MKLTEDRLFILSRFSPLYWEKFGTAYNKADAKDKVLNKNQIRALMILGNRRKATSSQLGKIMFMRKSSITSIVDSLINKGLINKEANEHDRRSSILSLTELGQQYRRDKYLMLHTELEDILDRLSEDDIKELFESLETATSILKKL